MQTTKKIQLLSAKIGKVGSMKTLLSPRINGNRKAHYRNGNASPFL